MPVARLKTPALKSASMRKPPDPTMSLSLPDEMSVPSANLLDYTWLIYGERKIGKTSLLAQFEDPFFLMFEPGAKALKLRKRDVSSWKEFETYVSLLEKNPDYCKMVVLDTGDMCYQQALAHVKKELGLNDIRDKAWGGGYVELKARFAALHDRLYRVGCGFAVTAHSTVKTVKVGFGEEQDKLSIQMSKQSFEYYAGIVDTIAYYHYNSDKERILTIRGHEGLEAGTRCKGHFLYEDGSPIVDIPMGNNEEEAFENLKAAFNNELPKPTATKRAAAVKKKTQ